MARETPRRKLISTENGVKTSVINALLTNIAKTIFRTNKRLHNLRSHIVFFGEVPLPTAIQRRVCSGAQRAGRR